MLIFRISSTTLLSSSSSSSSSSSTTQILFCKSLRSVLCKYKNGLNHSTIVFVRCLSSCCHLIINFKLYKAVSVFRKHFSRFFGWCRLYIYIYIYIYKHWTQFSIFLGRENILDRVMWLSVVVVSNMSLYYL